MRRWPTILALAVVSVVGLSGCSVPAGTDGNLVDDWPALADPQLVVPAVGACYFTQPASTWDGIVDHPVACFSLHITETAFVGAFTDDAAQRATPPPSGSPEMRTAFTTCTQQANDFLGGDWHTAAVQLHLVVPDGSAWRGGARWFRCDLSSSDDRSGRFESTMRSYKDGLRGSRPMADTCVIADDTDGHLSNIRPADCTKSHRGEFAGTYTASAGASYPEPGKSTGDPVKKGCEGVVARYVGTSAWNSRSDLGWMWWSYGRTMWDLGDHTVRCYALAYSGGRTRLYSGSLKNIGKAAIKS